MKTLTKLALAAVFLTTTMAMQAQTVNGYFRNNGTYVAPYYRTPANGIVYDNLSYRGYPSQQPGYATYTYSATTYPSCSSSTYGHPSSYSIYGSSTQIGGTTFHNYYSSDGGSLSGTTLTIGDTSFTTLSGW